MAEPGVKRLKTALERAASNVAQCLPDVEAAHLARQANALGQARIPKIFARELRPLDASLNAALLDLMTRADRAAQNRFIFFNRLQAFGQGIQWENAESPPWLGELHSFDYALDLAMAYRIFGEKRYAQHLRYLIADWVASNPPFEGTGWTSGTLSRRVRNWILAADLARVDWEADGQFFEVAAQSLALQALFLERRANQLSDDAERAAGAVALLLASRLFAPRSVETLRTAAFELLIHAGGDPADAAPLVPSASPMEGVGQARAAVELMLFAGSVQREVSARVRENVESSLRHVEEILLPDGRLTLLGSSEPPPAELLDDTFALAAVLLGAGWCKAIAPDFGILPYLLLGEEGKQRFQALASCSWKPGDVCRSSGGFLRVVAPSDSAAIVMAEPSADRKARPDFLSYELMIRGRLVIVDAGVSASPGEPGNGRFSNPLTHNVLLFHDQVPAARLNSASPSSNELFLGDGFKVLAVRGARFASGQVAYERFWFSLQDDAWLVCERLVGEGAGHLKSLTHFYPSFELSPEGEMIRAKSHSLELRVIPLGPQPARIVIGRGGHPPLPSLYSSASGVIYPADAMALEWEFSGGGWLGGYLIAPAAWLGEQAVRLGSSEDCLWVEAGGRTYRLPSRPPASPNSS